MKPIILLIVFLCASPIQAACKCSCEPTDNRICAGYNDLDNPCTGICPSQTAGAAPMITACPLTQVFNPIRGIKEWRTACIK